MYLDTVVVMSLIVVVLTCAIVVYVGYHAYKHIKAEMQQSESAAARE